MNDAEQRGATGGGSSNDWRVRPVLTVPEAAQILGISRGLAYEAARTGALPVLQFGRRRVVPVPRLIALLEGA